jgi:hypothetical protein
MKRATRAAKIATKPKPKPRPKPSPAAKPAGPSGGAEAAEWIAARGLSTGGKTRWNVNVCLDVVDAPANAAYAGDTATRFHLDLYRDEWGFVFVHKGKTSHIRRTDTAFVSGDDGHKLLKQMPALAEIGAFVRALEAKYNVAFKRQHALVRSNLAGAKATLGEWIAMT